MSDWVTLRDTLFLKLRPIEVWPGKLRSDYQREKSPYSAPLKDTLSILKRELSMLSARNIVLQIAIPERHLRLDGLPRAGATSEHPGVILCFDTPKGSRRRHFDRFTRWEYNLRALAMNLEHLRLANLYGVEGDDAQYAGWKALPPGDTSANPSDLGAQPPEQDAVNKAALFVARYGGNEAAWPQVAASAEVYQKLYREAAHRLHPDRPSGDAELFKHLQNAANILIRKRGL